MVYVNARSRVALYENNAVHPCRPRLHKTRALRVLLYHIVR